MLAEAHSNHKTTITIESMNFPLFKPIARLVPKL
jgi:hypothetical protein